MARSEDGLVETLRRALSNIAAELQAAEERSDRRLEGGQRRIGLRASPSVSEVHATVPSAPIIIRGHHRRFRRQRRRIGRRSAISAGESAKRNSDSDCFSDDFSKHRQGAADLVIGSDICLLYTSPSPRD